MKKGYIITIGLALGYVLGTFFVESYYAQSLGSKVYTYECEKPTCIPDTLVTGEQIYWDCRWNRAFLNGNVKVLYIDNDTTKGARLIALFTKQENGK